MVFDHLLLHDLGCFSFCFVNCIHSLNKSFFFVSIFFFLLYYHSISRPFGFANCSFIESIFIFFFPFFFLFSHSVSFALLISLLSLHPFITSFGSCLSYVYYVFFSFIQLIFPFYFTAAFLLYSLNDPFLTAFCSFI